ncbi:protein translocase subunit SecF [Halovivax gelatinilyticus]|uniref:protein translocase subunit SecF n=1 Tax=Halovivax gelatinilyticus TaxID=2961597 RepID=UPI0020CA6338|nr:protein translocase subunit SecF [Halovivax gelatinilyticus]
MAPFEVPDLDYTEYSNRQLVALPLGMLALALGILAVTFVATGAPLSLGLEFTGGAELTLDTEADREEVEAAFDQEVTSIQPVQGEDRYIVQFAAGELPGFEDDSQGVLQDLVEQAEANLEPADEGEGLVQSESLTSASFGAQTQTTALLGIAAAFFGMSIIAFALFRTFVPSVAIVVSAFSDIMIPLAFMNLANIDLTLGTVAALLMLIGYSVDSDILLNNHVLRRSGGFYESVHHATRTGITMTVTAMTAMAVMAISAWFFGVELLTSIGLILFVGLAADLMNTYLLNFSLLRWYKFEGVAR